MSHLGEKEARLAPNGTNPGLFQIWNILKPDLKSLGFVPFGVNQTHIDPKSVHPAIYDGDMYK